MVDDTDDFLAHYGVKGMKWGVRKADREAKKARKAQAKYENASEDSRAAQDAKRKMATSGSVDALSNKELQTLVTRMNLEQQLSGLQEKTQTKSAGRKFVEEIAREQVKSTVSGALKDSVGAVGRKIIADAINKKIKEVTKK